MLDLQKELLKQLQKGDLLRSKKDGKLWKVADVREEQKTATETEKIALVVDVETSAMYFIPFSFFNVNKFEVLTHASSL